MDTKTCTGPCGRDLPLTAYHRNGPRRHHSQCKECRALGYKLKRNTTFPCAPLALLERI